MPYGSGSGFLFIKSGDLFGEEVWDFSYVHVHMFQVWINLPSHLNTWFTSAFAVAMETHMTNSKSNRRGYLQRSSPALMQVILNCSECETCIWHLLWCLAGENQTQALFPPKFRCISSFVPVSSQTFLHLCHWNVFLQVIGHIYQNNYTKFKFTSAAGSK